MCTSISGLRDALNQAINNYEAALNPSLFDVPPVAPKAPQSPLPEYGHQTLPEYGHQTFPEYGHQTIPLDARNARINIEAPNSTFIFQGKMENVSIDSLDKQPSRGPKVPSANPYPFVINTNKAEEIIGLLTEYMTGIDLSKPKDLMMPVRAAFKAGVIRKPTYSEFKKALPDLAPKNSSSFDKYLRPDITNPYDMIPAYEDMRKAFEALLA